MAKQDGYLRYNEVTDRVGAGLSAACAAHCLIMPILITCLPFLGATFLVNDKFEMGLILFSCSLALASLCLGYREHGHYSCFILFSMAIFSFIIAHMREAYEAYLMAVAGATLALTHLINYWLCKRCKRCSH